MKITHVAVEYAELRSTGYPDFCNKRYGVGYSAGVEDGETAFDVHRKLLETAIRDVKLLHGDQVDDVTLSLVVEARSF